MSVENEYEVPEQVREASELAEELMKKLYGETEIETKEEEEVVEEETPPEEEASEEDDEDVEEEEEIDPKELKKWRDRYLSLKGKYDAEVPRLASQVRELMEKITQPEKKPVEPEVDEIASIEETYGKDFIENLRKVINNEVKQGISEVQEKVENVEETQVRAAKDSFMSYLDDAAEGWRDLWEGKDKGFIKFLSQKDPMGLNTYEQYLNKFNEEWDADGMAKIFNIYKESKNTKPNLSKEQEAMIAPSRQKASSTPVSSEKRIWTEETMKQFEYDDRNGKYSDEESQKLWGDLLAAASEGRIRR